MILDARAGPEAKPASITARRRAAPVIVWLLLCLIWGSTWSFIKVGLRDLPPLTFVSLRFAVAISDFGRSQLMRLTDLERWPHIHVEVHAVGFEPLAVRYEVRRGTHVGMLRLVLVPEL